MSGRIPTLRASALIAAASLFLHELRYLLGYGSHAQDELAAQGHGYLSFAGAASAVLLGLACAQLLVIVARAWRSGAGAGAAPPLGLTWLAASVVLTGVYTGQELLEAVLEPDHPGGLQALTAHGGLVAYPLAFALGGAVALLLRGAHAAVTAAARRGRPAQRPRVRAGRPRPLFRLDLTAPGALATGRAGWAPPLAS